VVFAEEEAQDGLEEERVMADRYMDQRQAALLYCAFYGQHRCGKSGENGNLDQPGQMTIAIAKASIFIELRMFDTKNSP
jgi:hypothetical protein